MINIEKIMYVSVYTKNISMNTVGMKSFHTDKRRIMHLISKSDVESVQISNLLIKTGARNTVYTKTMNLWQKNRKKTDNAFLFANCALASVYEETVASERHKYLSMAIAVLSDCIEERSDWWMARFLRGGALQAIVISSDGQLLQPNGKEDDLDILIRMQNESKEKEPYFLCTYLLKAKSCIFQGNVDGALETIQEGLTSVTPGTVKYPLNVLLQPFGDTIMILRSLKMEEMAESVKNFGLILFPKSNSLTIF